MSARPTHLVVGHITKPHGIRGEVSVALLTDHPEGVFVPGVVLRAAGAKGEAPDPDAAPLRIESARTFRGGYLVHFEGVLSRNDAERLRKVYLTLPVEDLADLEEGEFFYHQLVGMEVRTVEGRVLGRIQEVYEMLPADLLEVRGEGGTFLIPMTDGIVREVDAEAGRMLVDPPVGLLDL